MESGIRTFFQVTETQDLDKAVETTSDQKTRSHLVFSAIQEPAIGPTMGPRNGTRVYTGPSPTSVAQDATCLNHAATDPAFESGRVGNDHTRGAIRTESVALPPNPQETGKRSTGSTAFGVKLHPDSTLSNAKELVGSNTEAYHENKIRKTRTKVPHISHLEDTRSK